MADQIVDLEELGVIDSEAEGMKMLALYLYHIATRCLRVCMYV